MEMVYWFCLAVGGVFVLLAVVSGIDGTDLGNLDADLDADLDASFDSEADPAPDLDLEWVDPGDAPAKSRRLRPSTPTGLPLSLLTSFKFWTFGSCFFGLTGVVLSALGLNPLGVAIAATLMGLFCGASLASVLRLLRRRQVNSLVQSADLAGIEGIVEIPFDASMRGKVSLQIKGNLIEFIAYTNDPKPLEKGDRIFVIGAERDRLWVIPAPNAATPLPPTS